MDEPSGIWHLLDDPYHTKLVAWHVELFLFFFPFWGLSGVLTFVENFINVMVNKVFFQVPVL